MMKSLSRLFGGGKSKAEASPAKSGSQAEPKPRKPVAPKPKRPVEVLVAEDDAARAKSRGSDTPSKKPSRAKTSDAMFDTEVPLSTEPVRHRGESHARLDDDPIELSDDAGGETETMGPAHHAEEVSASAVDVRRVAEPDPADEFDDEDPGDTMQALTSRKGKAEMLNQLRKNYDEVLGIVRKVDQHLDDQARRSDRMLEIAERTAKHLEQLEHLGTMNERQREMAETMTRLVEITRAGNDQAANTGAELMQNVAQQLEAQRDQTSTLREVKGAVERAGEHDREMADSIKGFTDTIGGVKTATNELGHAITAMRENDAERERELAQIVARSQRWLIVTVVVVGVVAVGALAAVLMAAL